MASQAAISGTESENLRKIYADSNYAYPYSMASNQNGFNQGRPADNFMDSNNLADDEMTLNELKKKQAA